MERIIDKAVKLYGLQEYELIAVQKHQGGRNNVLICQKDEENRYVLRLSQLQDRCLEQYLAETEFIRYLYENGAPVANVVDSVNGKTVEQIESEGKITYASLFEYAKGILLCDNGYEYREGVPIEEYFYNCGKTLGIIHRLSKQYNPVHKRPQYSEKYNYEYIDRLIPDDFFDLKKAIKDRFIQFESLGYDPRNYGLVHFDFSDGNYHVDLNTGDITVFDFDNCMYCWYMFDLAHLYIHGEGWSFHLKEGKDRLEYMKHYFDTVIEGYRSETEVTEEMLSQLQLFIDMAQIEYIVDVFECCVRNNEEVNEEDFDVEEKCLVEGIPYAGIGED